MNFGVEQTKSYTGMADNMNFVIMDDFLYWAIGLILLVLALIIGIKLIKWYFSRFKHNDHMVFLVRLPKERPGDTEKEFTVQLLREEIAVAQTIFASIGGLRAQRGFNAWLTGRDDHFGFEVVANEKQIAFYMTAPKTMARYLEQQVQAHYPAAVMEEVPDYNIFSPTGVTKAGYLITKRNLIFPIKTYNHMDTDPLNTLVNIMSKLEASEGMALQFVVRSAKPAWHRRGNQVAHYVRRGKSVNEAIRMLGGGRFVAGLKETFFSKQQNKQHNMYEPQKKLTAMEEEMLKGIEEKNSKAGLEVNARIVVSALNDGSAMSYVNNIMNAFSQYNYYEYGNSFKQVMVNGRNNKLIQDFIYRNFNESQSFLLNTEEMASIYHLPLKDAETPNILWLTAKHASAPNNIPDEGLVLGRNFYRGIKKDVLIKREDRRRHMYIIGKSGVGKSFLITSMAVQDIMNGEGVCVIDPHGDLIEDILERVPPERAEDVILFAPADMERPLALNLLEFDARYPEQKTFVINEMINIFDKLYDLKSTGGPIFEQYMRNAMLLIMSDPESGSTLMEIPKILADPDFRKLKLSKCPDPTVVSFWRQEAEKAGGDAALANVVPYITSKLTQFISNDTMRPIIGQQKSSFNFRDIMDSQKILLVDLSKGQVGEMNAFLLGMILVGKILISALSRTDMPEEKRKDFYLYIDEFQNFTTDSISTILSEARKYNLNLIIAHQYIGQLTDASGKSAIKDAVFGNVGSWVTFKIGSEDAEVLEKEFSPVFNTYDLINIEKFTAYTKLLIDNTPSRPFSMQTIYPLPGTSRPEIIPKIKTLSRLKYGQDRKLIEAEIMRRGKIQG